MKEEKKKEKEKEKEKEKDRTGPFPQASSRLQQWRGHLQEW